MDDRTPLFFRKELMTMLGIDESGWEKLEAVEESVRREALTQLMVV
ncbi:MAG: hypothetical protein ACI8RZ_000762 [Myxococcota bacterium]|jgi:hypothetical protein